MIFDIQIPRNTHYGLSWIAFLLSKKEKKLPHINTVGFFLFHYYKKVDDQERRKGKGRGREREKREKGIRE